MSAARRMTRRAIVAALALVPSIASGAAGEAVELSRAELEDRIRGGLVGQLIGNLNGLPHEFRYLEEPGSVTGYQPGLPEGARTDDDTDLEWVYVVGMQRTGRLYLEPAEIVGLWRDHINRRIWSANQYARQLMDLGLEPPLTGHRALNPWSEFNIAGQFTAETFALMAPGLPQTASRLALHYTTVVVDGEPAQATQLFATMIAAAFTTGDLEQVIDAGVAAVDPGSEIRRIVADVRRWHGEHPADFRATRRAIKEHWSRNPKAQRDENGYELNTACTIAALLHGGGDFAATLETAFNCGWDADNNAATAGTVLGVMRGWRWMEAQGWPIADRYRNTTREGLPEDETISRLASRIVELADRVMRESRGRRAASATDDGDFAGASGAPGARGGGATVYTVPSEEPAPVRELVSAAAAAASLRHALGPDIAAAFADPAAGGQDLARATYLAICLDLAAEIVERDQAAWRRGLVALEGGFPQIAQVLFFRATGPSGDALRARALAAGLHEPAAKRPVWTFNLDLHRAALPPLPQTGLVERLSVLSAELSAAWQSADIDALIDVGVRLEQLQQAMTRRGGELAPLAARLGPVTRELLHGLELGEREPVRAAVKELEAVRAAAVSPGAAAAARGAAGAAPAPPPGPSAAAPRRPNVVIVFADDMGPEVGAYGDPVVRTPHLDRLAREGALFTRAYVVSPSCSPSRAALLTGRYPHSNGVQSLIQWHWPNRKHEVEEFPERLERTLRHTLPRSEILLSQHLKELGYATGIFAKWHVSVEPVTAWGFDEYWKEPEQFFAAHRDQPFFYYFAPAHTHVPFWTSADHVYDPAQVPLPPYFHDDDELRRDLADYYSAISHFDDEVGRVLAALDRQRLTENTVVIFASDNGPPYARAKATLYEWGIRTPLLVRYPGRIAAGRRIDALASLVDLYPTVLDLLGEPVPRRLQGHSLAPLLTGVDAAAERDAVFAELTHHGTVHNPMRSVRSGRFKYIRNFDPTAPFYTGDESLGLRLLRTPLAVPIRPVEELYDLDADPLESRNLASDPAHREQLLDMRELLQRWIRETDDDPLSELPLVSPEEAREQPGGWYGRPEDPAPNARRPRPPVTYDDIKRRFPFYAGVP